MTRIDTDQDSVTLINVFTVDPDHQDQLLDRLIEATEETMQDVPGFISANFHKSLDGERVVNYGQWESRAAYEAMSDNPEAAKHMRSAAELVTDFDAHLYEVEHIHETTE